MTITAGLTVLEPLGAVADTVAANTSTPIGAKPMMGFNNWARFTCAQQARLDGTRTGYSFQQFMQDQAKAMKDTGLVAAGYTNLTVDDCWMQRSDAGYLHGAAKWGGGDQPGFDWELTDYAQYVHNQGMQAGLYSTSGVNTCQGVPGGVMGHEQSDATSLAYWGIDSLKLDNCGTTSANRQQEFTTTANALNDATRDNPRKILFNESAPAGYSPSDSEKYRTMDWVRGLGQMWRVSPDIAVWHDPAASAWDWPHGGDYYEGGVLQNLTDTVALGRYNGSGNHNDADMVLIGDNKQLTPAEQRSQFALWSAMGSPLMISTDVRKMAADPVTYAPQLNILKNSDIIAVDQDTTAGGYLASQQGMSAGSGIEVVVKPLANGSRAVVVLNKNSSAVSYTLDLARAGFADPGCTHGAKNLWTHATSSVTGSITTTVGVHDSAMYVIDPGTCGAAAPVGQIQAAQPSFQVSGYCLDAYRGATSGATVGLYGCTGNANQQWRRQANGQIASLADVGLCLSGETSGLRLRTCANGDAKQLWTYNRAGQLKANGLCADIHGGALGDVNAAVATYSCGSDQPNQTWSAPFSTPPVP
ncbi:ricin-type beta-trefoil lectin domain protein [Amycolatopsis sp. H20-H5]|uniref:ricin-type beta-trefoil lectin domain protein n=1 Tax=Amycolatopsis sp. H20-H5 TaxID=3046309 RepID=UPI002DBF0AC4|nr:ricin-type beta-trefoil lectin domain protein [Amycolatopsis sp. H20-H5]MEC3978219.1 ricin-type beta-trefoil lectin domain protein [Amycolatopsis sp. H20-H5]